MAEIVRDAQGVYHVEVDGRIERLYVAGSPGDTWVFWNGRVYRGNFRRERTSDAKVHRTGGSYTLTSPMPASVLGIRVKAGDAVKAGDVLILLEAMKMELPVRAPADAVVGAIHCREGELVDADAKLIELK